MPRTSSAATVDPPQLWAGYIETVGRLALLIANDSFLDEHLHPLVAPRADARSLRKLLLDEEIGGFDSAAMLVNESKPEIERNIERVLGQAGPEDLVCLYFSGHGLRDGQGDLYFAVANTEQDLLRSTAVSAAFLLDLMEHSQAASIVLLLDCCYSGAFAKGFKGTTELREVLAVGRGRYVLTASNQIELARDGKVGTDGSAGHSAFTGVIVEGLRTGKADVDNDGLITPENLWTYVSREMRDKAPRQTPTKFGEVSQETHLARVSTGLHTALDPGLRVHLGDLLGRRSQTADQGYRAEDFPGLGRLIVPIGQVIEAGQRKNRVMLNLGRDHLLIVGRIGCGKSTLLRTLACGLSLTHTPDEARLVFLESGGAKLGSLRRLPHVASYVTNRDAAQVTGLLGRLEDVIGQRSDLFVQHYTANVAEFRDARERWDSEHPDYPHPTVFVFVDRWADFAATVPEFEGRMAALASAGLDVGVHVVISARGWGEVPRAVEALVSRRIEFGLTEAGTSRLDGATAVTLAAEPAGWAQMRDKRLRVALPSLDPVVEKESGAGEVYSGGEALTDGAPQLVEHVLRSNAASGAVAWRDWGVLRPEAVDAAPSRTAEAAPSGDDVAGGETRDPAVTDALDDPAAATGGGPDEAVGSEATGTEPAESAARLAGAVVSGTDAAEWANTVDRLDATPNPLMVPPRLEQLLGLPEVVTATDLESLRRDGDDGLVPFGIDAYGTQVAISFGRGIDGPGRPAGLVVGGDMSGKNQLVRSLLFSAVSRQPVSRLNLALFSYRSRNIFKSMEELPHQVVIAERLLDTPAYARRYAAILDTELDHRYVQRTRNGSLAASRLPKLLVAIDEFDELVALEPEFGDVIRRISNVGDQLGVRLLLSARSLSVEYLVDIEPHLGYRVALRCDAASSRAVIGNANAAELPESPGSGFLKVGAEPAIRFSNASTFHRLDNGMTLADHIIELANDLERPAKDRWAQPMTGQPDLSDLIPVENDPVRGLGVALAGRRTLKVPIGLIEQAGDFRTGPLTVDFAGEDTRLGSLLITGAHKSGKPQLAVAATVALALTHTPKELHAYIVSPYPHSRLEYLARLPHVGGFATAENPQQVRRTIHELFTLLQKRRLMRDGNRVSSFEEYLRLRASGTVKDPYARVLLVIRGWSQLKELFPELTTMALDLIHRGDQYGIHTIVTSSGDVTDLLVPGLPRPLRRLVTVDDTGFDGEQTRPGVTAGGNCHGVDETGSEFTGAYAEPLIEQITGAWNRGRAPRIPAKALHVTVDSLPPASGAAGLSVPIGIDVDTLGPVSIDFADTPHLLFSSASKHDRNPFLIALTRLLTREQRRDRTVTVFSTNAALIDATSAVPGVQTYNIPRGNNAGPALQLIQTRLASPGANRFASLPRRIRAENVQEFIIVDCYEAPRSLTSLVHALWAMMDLTTPDQMHLILACDIDRGVPGISPLTDIRPAVLRIAHPRSLEPGAVPHPAQLTEPRGERTVHLAQPDPHSPRALH